MGDEFHFVMNYSKFKTSQSQLIKKHHTIRSSAITFDKLMNSSKMLELKNLLHKYIYQYYTKFNQFMYIITLIIMTLSPPGFISPFLFNNRY